MNNQKQPSLLFFNACFDKGQLKNLIAWFLESYGEKITVDFLETLKHVGFHQATRAGVSLGLDDLQIPTQKSTFISQAIADVQSLEQNNAAGNITSVEKSQRMIDTWNQTSELLRQNAVQNFRNTNPVNPVYMMAFSGARGNISQVRQLVAMRGLMADPQGAILEFPIQSNFREGLTLTEYLISCYGARKGLVDTALRTATSGYLTRRLVDAVQHVVVSMVDCGTEKNILLKDLNLESRLIGRVLAQNLELPQNIFLVKNQIISPLLAKMIAKNTTQVFVRSPLTCEAYKAVCQMCYGWNLANGNLVSIGEAVGVIAAQSIGEPGTQLTMRTFHTGGVGVFSDQAMKAINSPFTGVVEFSENLTGHFVRTPHGQIVYMLKYVSFNSDRVILKVKNKENSSLSFSITEKELPTGSLLLVRQGEKVKTGQLLAQSSQIKTSKQQMPETTHPVQATMDGEVYFESMFISKQKELQARSKRKKTKEDELGPDIRTLIGLGSFWVFAGENNREFHIAKPVVQQGDLVSKATAIFQYNFHIPQRAQLKKVKSHLAFGQTRAEIPLEKVRFHKFGYSLSVLPKQEKIKNFAPGSNKKHVLFYSKTPKDQRLNQSLIWYPAGSSVDEPGYFWFLNNYYEHKNEIISENLNLNLKASNKTLPQGNFFYSSQPLLKVECKSQFDSFKVFLIFGFQPSIGSNNQRLALKTLFSKKAETSKLKFSSFIFNPCLNIVNKRGLFHTNSDLLKKTFHNNISAQIKSKKAISFRSNFIGSSNKAQAGVKNPRLVLKTEFSRSGMNTPSLFLSQGLNKVKDRIYNCRISNSLVFEEKQGWLFIPASKTIPDLVKQVKTPTFVETGHLVSDVLFPNGPISAEFIGKLKVLKSQKEHSFNKETTKPSWYRIESFLDLASGGSNFDFIVKLKEKNGLPIVLDMPSYSVKKRILFYKLSMDRDINNEENSKNSIFQPQIFGLCQNQKRISTNTKKNMPLKFLLIKSLKDSTLPTKLFLTEEWINVLNKKNLFKINSPIFTKQYCTDFSNKTSANLNFQFKSKKKSGWFSPKQFFRVEVTLESPIRFKKVISNFNFFASINKKSIATIGFRFFLYDLLLLKNPEKFKFETFKHGWVLPNKRLTTGFVKLKSTGEFRRLKSTQSESVTSIMRNNDVLTFEVSPNRKSNLTEKVISNSAYKNIQVGDLIRWGDEIFPGLASSASGQVLKMTEEKIIIRLGISTLASARGIIHVFHNDLIKKNDLLVTLKSRRLQTEDIVQGIPKIEQLFEARETKGGEIIANSVHTKLQNFFVDALKSGNLSLAVPESVQQIQFFLVASILEAYLNQGVKISEKHVEVVVRQMTTRVRILAGGDTGLLPGELVQLTWIQELNNQLKILGNRQATYEPIILGITKSVLQSESFLLAASFQEVSRVLVRSALSRKTDFLRGLHENVILGQLVPAGTGLLVDTQDEIKTNSLSVIKLNP